MEGNKDEALRCVEVAKSALKSGDQIRAVKFLSKARRLDPSLSFDHLDHATSSQTDPKPEIIQRNPKPVTNRSDPSSDFSKEATYTQEQTDKKAISHQKSSTSMVAIDERATTEPHSLIPSQAPLMLSYNDRIRPLLDVVDKLRLLKVAQEGIMLPTIVVVGDQSAGKSSVLESLAGINLPRGQGICTRVPLIMRLQHHLDPVPELYLEFQGQTIRTDEANVSEAIKIATGEIAGNGKGISNTPLTLVVKKRGVPDLTMVDLPGITRVPVHGQPEDIYEQIMKIIMEYIEPEESIILNVLSATVDFSTCESIRMSQKVDKMGQRTLAVVTKVDKNPEGLLEKVTADDVNIGLGYVCVRNRIGDEQYEEARIEESVLFETHNLLSKIDKSMVGVPVLAQRLVHIQATIISKTLPDIVRKINEKLQANAAELSKLPQNLSSVSEAMVVVMRILGSSKESLRKLIQRGEYDEYLDEKEMHCMARLAEMLNKYSDELQKSAENKCVENFLMDEIHTLEEANGIALPNFLPRTAFLQVLQRKVNDISGTPIIFIDNVWQYIENVVVKVLSTHSGSYPHLQSATRRAACNLCSKIKEKALHRVLEIIEMEKLSDYTCCEEYTNEWVKLMATKVSLMGVLNNHSSRKIELQGFGEVEIGHLRFCANKIEQAFDLKMRITAYWKIVLKRFVDNVALHLLLSIRNLVNKELEEEIVHELMDPQGGGIERMLEAVPSIAIKRERINKSIKVLRDSKQVVAQIMDRIIAEAD